MFPTLLYKNAYFTSSWNEVINLFQRKVNITRIKRDHRTQEYDTVLIESPIDILVNSQPLVNVICLAKDLKELAVGFLFSIGLIDSYDDVKRVQDNALEGKINVDLKKEILLKKDLMEINPISRVIDTTCGIPSPWRNLIKKKIDQRTSKDPPVFSEHVKAELIYSSIVEMQRQTTLFKTTGGCHGAAAFDFQGTLLSLKEDIGRHNAIDKVIGDLLIANHDFKNLLLTSTGRLTGDSVLKAVRARIPIVASLSAAIESGIRLAFGYGITLIGFVRGNGMNIYTHPERIAS
jgi:FdhD protein